MGVSGVPEVINGANVGFSDFSEFSVQSGSSPPAGITAFGIGGGDPDDLRIVNDPAEGNYFSMAGNTISNAYAYGLDSFFGEAEFGEMLARMYFNVPATNRSNMGPVFSLQGLVGGDPGPSDLNFSGGSISLPGDGIPQSDGKAVTNGGGTAPLNNNNIQESSQNPEWIWFRIRRTQNSGTPANDDWQGTAWYGAFEDEPVAIDGSASNITGSPRGVLAMGWGAVPFTSTSEQRIAYLSFSSDPDLAAPPIPGALSQFPSVVVPMTVGDLWSSGALKDMSPSGLLQSRSTKAAGWSWQSAWPTMNLRNLSHQALQAFIYNAWSRGQIFLIKHPLVPGSGIAPNGLGTGTVIVKGAAQLIGADEIITDGWPISTAKVSKAGDAIKIDGDSGVYIVTENAASDGSGEATLQITPPLRKVPADDSSIQTTSVEFRALISTRSELEPSRLPELAQGPSVTFTEALN